MISEVEILGILNASEANLRPAAGRLWKVIKIEPSRWEIVNSKRSENYFWVVGILGSQAIWYNHIEQDFSLTPFIRWGQLDRYEDAEMSLEYITEQILRTIEGEQKYSS